MYTQQQSQLAEAREITDAPDIFIAVQRLWDSASGGLSEEELKWFARCGDRAQIDLGNMSTTLKNIGYSIASDETSGVFEDAGNVSRLLFFMAESMRGIRALVFLGKLAADRLRFGKVSG